MFIRLFLVCLFAAFTVGRCDWSIRANGGVCGTVALRAHWRRGVSYLIDRIGRKTICVRRLDFARGTSQAVRSDLCDAVGEFLRSTKKQLCWHNAIWTPIMRKIALHEQEA
jgi:hypothetical protein